MTANVITYRGRSAAREVGKVLGFDEETLDRLVGAGAHVGMEGSERHDRAPVPRCGLGSDASAHPEILSSCIVAVQDLPRHLGQHSGGMVICQGQLDSVVPLEPAAMPGRVVVQWDKEDCADMGIIKVDLLGLGMMAVLEESIELIRDALRRRSRSGTSAAGRSGGLCALQQADTIGMFQVESRAQMSCLPRLRPKSFTTSWCRWRSSGPGRSSATWCNPYLKRRQGREPVNYAHPVLEPVLEAHAGRAAVSGAVAAHGDDLPRISPAARRKSCGARWASSDRKSA